jgi:1-acyl-sn-glycerol-3-phosphate acyltransferase
MQRLVTAWVWTLWVLIVLVTFPTATVLFALTAPFDPGRYAVGRLFRFMGSLGARLNPWWDFRTEGVRVADRATLRGREQPRVVPRTSPHLALPWEMKWLAKKTIFKIPVRDGSCAWPRRPLVRAAAESAVGALAMCRDRSGQAGERDGLPRRHALADREMLPFKTGVRAGERVPGAVLPIALAGTRDAWQPSFRVNARAPLAGARPIPTDGLHHGRHPVAQERVRATIDGARLSCASGCACPPVHRPHDGRCARERPSVSDVRERPSVSDAAPPLTGEALESGCRAHRRGARRPRAPRGRRRPARRGRQDGLSLARMVRARSTS